MGATQQRVKDLTIDTKRLVRRSLDGLGNAALSPPRSAGGRVHLHGPRDRRAVALTFDDGPSAPSTTAMLDVLDSHGVHGTFFCVGEQVSWCPEVLERAVAGGHVVGNHSMHHSRRQAMSWSDVAHLEAASAAIADVIGRRPALYRAAWGWITPWEARRVEKLGMASIGWDVYPDDWKVPETPATTTAEQICSRVQNGSIVLMHDATSGIEHCTKTESARAADIVIRRLRAEGYEFVTVPELLGIAAYC